MKNEMLVSTAKAWGLKPYEVQSMHDWVTENVPSHEQSRAFTALLRKANNESSKSRNGPVRLVRTAETPPTSKRAKRKQPKTQGLEWVQHSLNAFNGSGYADRDSAELFLASYIDYNRWRKRPEACHLADEYYQALLPLAQHLLDTSLGPSHIPQAKNLAKFQQSKLL